MENNTPAYRPGVLNHQGGDDGPAEGAADGKRGEVARLGADGGEDGGSEEGVATVEEDEFGVEERGGLVEGG